MSIVYGTGRYTNYIAGKPPSKQISRLPYYETPMQKWPKNQQWTGDVYLWCWEKNKKNKQRKTNKNRGKQNFEDEANNLQLDKEDTQQSNLNIKYLNVTMKLDRVQNVRLIVSLLRFVISARRHF